MYLTNKILMLATIFLLFFQCGNKETHPPSKAETILTKACQFLWEKQSKDGGWHSETHGLLKGGQAWTPFILFALMDIPNGIYQRPEKKVDKALDFIRKHINREGALGLADPDVLEYPNYATAYALRILIKQGNDADKPLIAMMKNYLVQQQFVEHRGISEQDLVYGGWGFGETNLLKGQSGHIDLSHTRRILQALKETGHSDSGTYKKAKVFLRLLQKHPLETRKQPLVTQGEKVQVDYDGGFYFSPNILDANKAGSENQSYFRSYATATCDGVLALLAAGYRRDDEPVQAAIQWLENRPDLSHPQGIPKNDPEQWHKVIFYYHLSVRSEVYQILDWQDNWRGRIIDLLSQKQQENGSFFNPYGAPNKEDDPLLATAMVVSIIENILKH